jgi:uncharacterized membrane protein YfcA
VGELVGVGLAVALAAAVQLAAGFGFGLTAVPLLSLSIGAHDAVVLALALATITNGAQAWLGRHRTDRPVAGRMLAGAALGLPIGLVVYQLVDDRVLRIVIGVAVLGAVVVIARGLDLRHAGPGLDVGGGLAAGALTLSTGVNGPPLVLVLQARHFDQDRFRSTITTIFVVLDIVGIVTFAITGDLDAEVLQALVASLPGLAVGAAVGIAVRGLLDPRRFRILVLTLLTTAAASTLLSAVRS